MEDLDRVNTERHSIIGTLNTEKALMEVSCNKKEEALEKEIDSPAYYGLEVVGMMKNFLEWNKSIRAIDLRIIKEMDEWVKAVRRVVIGVESQESKLKQQEQINDTLRTQINTLKEKMEQQGKIIPEFEQPIIEAEEKIKEIEANRLSNEELKKGEHLFKVEGQIGLICWYLYNKTKTSMEIDENFKFSSNTSNTLIRKDKEGSQYVKEVDKIGKKIIYTLSDKGKEYVEEVIKRNK